MLSITDARDMPFDRLLAACEQSIALYDKPNGVETQGQRILRISTTLDEAPQVYRWFLQLHSFCDHWADSFGKQFGQKDDQYKAMRQRRDMFEDMARAINMRYEAASRLITLDQAYDPTGMPRQRRG